MLTMNERYASEPHRPCLRPKYPVCFLHHRVSAYSAASAGILLHLSSPSNPCSSWSRSSVDSSEQPSLILKLGKCQNAFSKHSVFLIHSPKQSCNFNFICVIDWCPSPVVFQSSTIAGSMSAVFLTVCPGSSTLLGKDALDGINLLKIYSEPFIIEIKPPS